MTLGTSDHGKRQFPEKKMLYVSSCLSSSFSPGQLEHENSSARSERTLEQEISRKKKSSATAQRRSDDTRHPICITDVPADFFIRCELVPGASFVRSSQFKNRSRLRVPYIVARDEIITTPYRLSLNAQRLNSIVNKVRDLDTWVPPLRQTIAPQKRGTNGKVSSNSN